MIQHQHLVVSGIGTDVIIQRFSDRTLVLVTQLGKVGHLVLSIFLYSRGGADESRERYRHP